MYFSIKTDPSPKADKASLMARFICSSSTSSDSTTRIPFPPPPAEALMSIGNPISFAIIMAFFGSVIASSIPGTIGISYALTASLAASLLPIVSIAF